MPDLIVTTPKSQIKAAAAEAAACLKAGEGYYYRFLGKRQPKECSQGSCLWYVEDGYVRGFAKIMSVIYKHVFICGTTGHRYNPGYYVVCRADTWKWVMPVEMKGFQGWRYYKPATVPHIVGTWTDKKPIMYQHGCIITHANGNDSYFNCNPPSRSMAGLANFGGM